MGREHHRRFFVPPEAIREGHVDLDPVQAHQIARVLRLAEGDTVSILDGTGRAWTAILSHVTARCAGARLAAELPRVPLPELRITLAQVVPRGPAMDLIVAKATELGVCCFQPLEATHSVRRGSGRGPRWRRIAIEAAEQCGRRDLPVLAEPCTLGDFLERHPRHGPLLACHGGADRTPLLGACQELRGVSEITLLVGGEGGLAPEEAIHIEARGGRLVSLGPRLLRAETAALAALSVLQAFLGDWVPQGDRESRLGH